MREFSKENFEIKVFHSNNLLNNLKITIEEYASRYHFTYEDMLKLAKEVLNEEA